MADDVRLTSTTDSPAQVAEALGVDVADVKNEFGDPLPPAADESTAAAQATANRDDPADPAPDDASRPDEQPPARRRDGNRVVKRLHRTLEANATLRGASAAKDAEIAALRQRITELVDVPRYVPPPAAPPPALDDFKTYEDWTTATARWAAQDAMQEQAVSEVRQQQAASWDEQQQLARQELPNYDATIATGADIRVHPAAEREIIQSPVGARLLYELTADRGLAERFGRADAAGQLKILGALEAHLAGARRPAARGGSRPSRPITQAPDPINPVGSSGVVATKPMDQLSYQEYKAARAAQERAKRGL